jgi:leucine dehydrogenase
VRRGERSGLYTIVAVHSTVRGPALGGCRLWSYPDSRSAVRDALRLSRAMTYKSAVADLPLGGGKGVIMLPDRTPALSSRRRKAALEDFGDTVERLEGRYITAEDVGISSRDMAVIGERTEHVTGLSRRRGGSGDPSPFTALGVQEAIQVACQRVFGTSELRERTIAILGLGHVGGRLARACAEAGAELVLSDIDPGKRALANKLGARWADPARALFADVDVVAPCALGGILDHESIPRLRCAVVAGSANNQLADDSLADLLRAHGVLWVPDFVANAGGLINVAEELRPGGYHPRRARERVQGIEGTLDEVFGEAERTGTTPLTAAMLLARRRLGQAVRPRSRRRPDPA